MAEIDDLDRWIQENHATKQGTPEFVQNAARYRELRAQEKAAALPDAEAEQRGQSPYGVNATMNRIFSGAVTGIPDLAIAGYNAGARAAGYPGAQADYLGPQMIAAGGGAPLPADASTTRQLLEGGGSALLGGGAGAIRGAIANAPSVARSLLPALGAFGRTTVAPTVASHYGGQAGGAIADALGLDKETGSLMGSLLGGVGAGRATELPARYTDWRYRGQGRDNAAEVAAAAARQGVTPTAGALGNADVQALERQLGNRPGAMSYINARRQSAHDEIAAALDRAAAARGSTDPAPTPGTIGEKITTAAGETAQAMRDRSEAAQARLQDRIGAGTPVEITPMRNQGYNMMTDPQAGLSVPGREAIDYRLTAQLNPLINRDASGAPILQGGTLPPGIGHNNPPPGALPGASETVPYGPFRSWRTDLGKSLDTATGGRMPPAAALYDPATEAMRRTAEGQGVPRQNFENIQAQTRAVEQQPARPGQPTGDYPYLMGIAGREPSSAYNYLHGGLQNPDRLGMLEATQHPQVPGIFGDYLRLLGDRTIDEQGARGPAKLATALERMHPEARSTLAGDQLPAINDIATLARSIDYPTSQTGLGRTVGPIAEGAGRLVLGSEALGHLGAATGIPGAGIAGRMAAIGIGPAYRALQARMLQSETARNALAGGPRPPNQYTINDLAAAINAANAAQQQRRGR